MINAVSNYEKTKLSMANVFLQYDQDTMIAKFSLKHDPSWLYLSFVKRIYRINRKSGNVQWSEDDCDMLPPLKSYDFEVGASCSIALQGKAKTGYPRVSRGSFLAGYRFFSVSLRTFLYIFFPSFRILTAAFTSRSIRFPHSHMYVRSDKASSFFLFPHTLHILLDAK